MPNVKIEYKDKHGRRVSSFADALMPSIQDSVADRIKAVRCPLHGRRATSVVARRSGTRLDWEARGLCCEALRDAITRMR